MGVLLAKFYVDRFYGQKFPLVMLGLAGSGKSTILYKLDPKARFSSFNGVKSCSCKEYDITAWNLDGNRMLRALSDYYVRNCKALVYVLDSSDKALLPQAKEEFYTLLKIEELKDVPILVLANKQDCTSETVENIVEEMNLCSLKSHKWHVQATTAILNKGVEEGFKWLQNQLPKKVTFL